MDRPTSPPASPAANPPGRLEDGALLRGAGRFLADRQRPGLLHVAFLRSPMAHARIAGLDLDAARAAPGVRLVAAGADLAADGVAPIPWEVAPPGAPPDLRPGDPAAGPTQPAIPIDRVRFVGEIVAMVVAGSPQAARDAVDMIEVELDPLPAVVDPDDAVAADAPELWPERAGNVAFTLDVGDGDATAAALAASAHVVDLELRNPRQIGVALESRGYLAEPLADGRWCLHATAGKPHNLRDTLARLVFGIAPEQLVVRTGDIGGGFGVKNVLYPETVAVLWAARRLRAPVVWVGDRSESFLADIMGRDQSTRAELGLDADGRLTALRVRTRAGLGAYLSPRGVVPPTAWAKIATAVYDIPAVDVRVSGVFTNQVPTCSFRGAGQPEVIYVVERLLDEAARRTGRTPSGLRAANLIKAAAMPFRTPTGVVYDSGDFATTQRRAEWLADVAGFAERRRASEARGRRRGLGLAQCIEACGFGFGESAALLVRPDGTAELKIGTQSSGQGHRTVYAKLVAEALGLEPAAVAVVQGDTERVAAGSGTGASRSLTVGGSACLRASEAVIERGRALAADALEVAAADLRFEAGAFRVRGTDRRVRLVDVAAAAAGEHPEGLPGDGRFTPDNFTFPNGTHVCEVEIDPATGRVAVLAYTVVQDVGRAVDTRIVEGQLHGGIAMGIGQALGEDAAVERATGQVIAGNLVDYAVPRAADLPWLRVALVEVASRHNPLGAKGVGEAGTTGAPAAVMNAVHDALAPLGVAPIDMPATPGRVWAALQARRDT